MEEIGVEYSDGFSGKIHPKFNLDDFSTLRFRTSSRYGHRFEIPVFNLIKIHGSAAWRQQERKNRKTDIYFDHALQLITDVEHCLAEAKSHLINVCTESKTKEQEPTIRPTQELIQCATHLLDEADETPRGVKAFTQAYNKLGIVNPDKRKFATTVMHETYYELIRRLANELEKENSVLFVHGFSFRDEHLRDIILRAARTNPTLQIIVFCHGRGDVQSYKNLLPDVDIKNENIEFVAPAEPTEGEKERKINLDVLRSDYFAPIIFDKVPDSAQRIELDIHTSTTETTGD